MPQAYIAEGLVALGASAATAAALAAIIQTILVNVALGALELEDDGDRWRAV